MKDSIVSAADRIEIIELINQFGMLIDLRDWENFANLFTDSVEFDYSSIGEVAGSLEPKDIVNSARNDLGGFQATQHMITNHHIKFSNNNHATCQAHVRAFHYLPGEPGKDILEMGGYYTAGLIRTDSTWKIKRWKFNVLWSRGNQQIFDVARQKVV
ncbi:hypothetical protein NIES267_21130 [Calothrix parasitica NIES-267]|uniref:SnoaL-like domain-containing protein n=1 Tax=Calothrix parasitica NIES-267 TaxID=1973488 RepID=A0A1Z4LN37_9CYAN|nr:hypothetical protein NIES267_21130 [Calothrix parasitica NIES-267]